MSEQNIKPGHIICATTVVDLANRKVVDDEENGLVTKFRRKDFNLNLAFRDVLSSVSFDRDAWINSAIKTAEWPEDRRPSIQTGLVASVDEVISSNEWREHHLGYADKLLGVEMEAGGVCAAAAKYNNVPVSMLRAVSDNADPAKTDDRWRTIGMKTLAQLILMLPYDALFEALKG
jgi:nucleoside phosphorylase